jgi:hypothetical protein
MELVFLMGEKLKIREFVYCIVPQADKKSNPRHFVHE